MKFFTTLIIILLFSSKTICCQDMLSPVSAIRNVFEEIYDKSIISDEDLRELLKKEEFSFLGYGSESFVFMSSSSEFVIKIPYSKGLTPSERKQIQANPLLRKVRRVINERRKNSSGFNYAYLLSKKIIAKIKRITSFNKENSISLSGYILGMDELKNNPVKSRYLEIKTNQLKFNFEGVTLPRSMQAEKRSVIKRSDKIIIQKIYDQTDTIEFKIEELVKNNKFSEIKDLFSEIFKYQEENLWKKGIFDLDFNIEGNYIKDKLNIISPTDYGAFTNNKKDVHIVISEVRGEAESLLSNIKFSIENFKKPKRQYVLTDIVSNYEKKFTEHQARLVAISFLEALLQNMTPEKILPYFSSSRNYDVTDRPGESTFLCLKAA